MYIIKEYNVMKEDVMKKFYNVKKILELVVSANVEQKIIVIKINYAIMNNVFVKKI